MSANRARRNLPAQERVARALWRFAYNLQFHPTKGCMSTLVSGEQAGTTLSLDHVQETLSEVMDAFGYVVTEVQ